MSEAEKPKPEGWWGKSPIMRRFHVYGIGESPDNTALCGKWMYGGPKDQQAVPETAGPDDCKECVRRVWKAVK